MPDRQTARSQAHRLNDVIIISTFMKIISVNIQPEKKNLTDANVYP
jgi:hypothetical protein